MVVVWYHNAAQNGFTMPSRLDITGKTHDVRIIGNTIRETRQPLNRTGIRIGKDVGAVQLDRNTIEGFATATADHRGA